MVERNHFLTITVGIVGSNGPTLNQSLLRGLRGWRWRRRRWRMQQKIPYFRLRRISYKKKKFNFFSAGEGEKRAGGVCQFVRKMPVYMKIAVWFLKKIGPDKDGRCWHFIWIFVTIKESRGIFNTLLIPSWSTKVVRHPCIRKSAGIRLKSDDPIFFRCRPWMWAMRKGQN